MDRIRIALLIILAMTSCVRSEKNTDIQLIERHLTRNGQFALPEYRIDAHYESIYGAVYTLLIPYPGYDTMIVVLGIKREREIDYCFTSMLTRAFKDTWKEEYLRFLALDSVYLAFGEGRYWEHERFWTMHTEGLDPEDTVMIEK